MNAMLSFSSSAKSPPQWRKFVAFQFNKFRQAKLVMGDWPEFMEPALRVEGIINYNRGVGATFESEAALTFFLIRWS